MTLLHLEGGECSIRDLINLSQVRNLGALTLGKYLVIDGTRHHPTDLIDRVIRAWSRAAEDGAFAALRLLACRRSYDASLAVYKEKGLVEHVSPYLSRFPNLAIFVTQGYPTRNGTDVALQETGWLLTTGLNLVPPLLQANTAGENWHEWVATVYCHPDSVMEGVLPDSRMLNVRNWPESNGPLTREVPLLQFVLGSGRDKTNLASSNDQGVCDLPWGRSFTWSVRTFPPVSGQILTEKRAGSTQEKARKKARVIKASQQQVFDLSQL